MEEVLEKLETAVVDEEAGNKNFQELYKNWGRFGNQEERRKEVLSTQKIGRQNKLDEVRGILNIVHGNEQRDIFNTTPRAFYTPRVRVPGFTRAVYKDVLMLSEWLIEKPEDFHQSWGVVPCPKGKRVLLVATGGNTKLFAKCGRFVTQVRTCLPGGDFSYGRKACTVLDGIFNEKLQTMYILDMLAWNNRSMAEAGLDFRQYWLHSQFRENNQFIMVNKPNSIKLELLPMSPCTPETLNKVMMTYPHFKDFKPALDGLLFYHINASYISGETPVVGWLYPYMVPEVLGSEITVHPQYMAQKPKDYVDQATFIEKFEKKYAKKKKNRSKGAMEISDYFPAEIDYDEGYYAVDDDTEGVYAEGVYAEGDYAEGDYAEGKYAEGDYVEGNYAEGDYAAGDYVEGEYAEGGEMDAEESVKEGDETGAQESVKEGDETGAQESVKEGDETGAEKSVKADTEYMESENVAEEATEQNEPEKDIGSATKDEEMTKDSMQAEEAPK